MIGDKKILAVTLARKGSSRIKDKNTSLVGEKRLICYTIDEVKKSKYIDKYIVSTNDPLVGIICSNSSVHVFNRNDKFAGDCSKSSDALIEVVLKHSEYDYVVEIMCTNPLKTIKDIDSCIEKLHTTGCDSIVSVVRVWDNHPSRVKYIEKDRLMDFYPEIPESRRQDLSPPAYVRNGSIYATTKKSLLDTGLRLGKDTRPYIMPPKRTINIDEPIDLLVAEQMLCRKRH